MAAVDAVAGGRIPCGGRRRAGGIDGAGRGVLPGHDGDHGGVGGGDTAAPTVVMRAHPPEQHLGRMLLWIPIKVEG